MIETQQGLTRQSKASDKRETEITKKKPTQAKPFRGTKSIFSNLGSSSASY